MAIAVDSALTTYTATGLSTSITRAHTCTGSDNMLFAAFQTATISTDNITDVTYDSVSFFSNLVGRAVNGADVQSYIYWQAQGTGDATSHNVVATCSTPDVFRLYTASYTGVDQASPIDATALNETNTGGANATESTTITVVAENCWAFMLCTNNAAAPVPRTNAVELTTGTGGGFGCFHSNSTVATGSYTMGWSIPVGSNFAQATVLFSFKPATGGGGVVQPRFKGFSRP